MVQRRRYWRRAGVLLASAAMVTGCDIPTQAPILTGTVILPVKPDSVSVNDLLPSSVTVSNGAFVVSINAATGTQTLGQLCPSCPSGVAPKPAFAGTFSSSVSLPSTVAQVTLAGGTVALATANNLGFDPIRPSSSARGTITTVLSSNGATLDSLVIDGNVDALPSGSTLNKSITLPVGGVVNTSVNVVVTVASPAGDPVVLNRSSSIAVTGTPSGIRASQAIVRVSNQAISPTSSSVDLNSVSASVREKIQGATLNLAVVNPFPVGGTLTLRFTNGTSDIIPSRTITVTGGNQSIDVVLSMSETNTLLASNTITVQLSGSVTGTASSNLVTVSPGQVVKVNPKLVLSTRIGG